MSNKPRSELLAELDDAQRRANRWLVRTAWTVFLLAYALLFVYCANRWGIGAGGMAP